MNKPVRVILVDEAKNTFVKLNENVGSQKSGNSFDAQLLKSIQGKVELIKNNPFYGDNIKKERIPKEYKGKVQNLWRIELNNFWRMLYTIRGDEIEIICFILKVCNHKEYNKMFGYK